jgi:hypothetical protein
MTAVGGAFVGWPVSAVWRTRKFGALGDAAAEVGGLETGARAMNTASFGSIEVCGGAGFVFEGGGARLAAALGETAGVDDAKPTCGAAGGAGAKSETIWTIGSPAAVVGVATGATSAGAGGGGALEAALSSSPPSPAFKAWARGGVGAGCAASSTPSPARETAGAAVGEAGADEADVARPAGVTAGTGAWGKIAMSAASAWAKPASLAPALGSGEVAASPPRACAAGVARAKACMRRPDFGVRRRLLRLDVRALQATTAPIATRLDK